MPPMEGKGDFSAPSDRETLADKAQKELDAAIGKLLPSTLRASTDFVTEAENAVREAKSFDELEEALAELLAPSMKPDELERFLARAMTAAAGHGAGAVRGEEEEDDA